MGFGKIFKSVFRAVAVVAAAVTLGPAAGAAIGLSGTTAAVAGGALVGAGTGAVAGAALGMPNTLGSALMDAASGGFAGYAASAVNPELGYSLAGVHPTSAAGLALTAGLGGASGYLAQTAEEQKIAADKASAVAAENARQAELARIAAMEKRAGEEQGIARGQAEAALRATVTDAPGSAPEDRGRALMASVFGAAGLGRSPATRGGVYGTAPFVSLRPRASGLRAVLGG